MEHNWPQKKFNYYAPGSHLFSGYMFLGSLLTLSSLAILETSILEPVTGHGSVYTGSPLECTGHQTLHQRVGYDVRPTGDKELGRYENIRMAAEYDSWSRVFFWEWGPMQGRSRTCETQIPRMGPLSRSLVLYLE